jgi:thymidylate kinase
MSEQARFITVHGIDGTGKTTLVAALKTALEQMGIDVAPDSSVKPSTPWRKFRSDFGDMTPTQRLFYKLGSKAAEGERIAEGIHEGRTTVKDRWVIDVLADETHKGAVAPREVYPSILQPDLAVVLWCSEDERVSRIANRPDATPDDLIPLQPGTRADYFHTYLIDHIAGSAADSLTLNTTQSPPEELAQIVLERAYE